MRFRSAFAPVALVLLLACGGCGASTAKTADGPDGEKTETPSSHGENGDTPAAKVDGPAAPTTGSVKREGGATDVPDDYSLTENDCQALGRGYGDAARSDQRTALNPKLTAKQREQADASIDGVVTKLAEKWEETCLKSLAGKIVEHAKVKCALGSKTVKAFDICLNGEAKK